MKVPEEVDTEGRGTIRRQAKGWRELYLLIRNRVLPTVAREVYLRG